MTSINLPRAVLELHRFASTDDYRRNLRKIRIETTTTNDSAKLDTFTAIATDGFRLATFTWNRSEADSLMPAAFSIQASAAKQALVGAKKNTVWTLELVSHSTEHDAEETHSKLNNGQVSVISETEMIAFPDWQQVQPERQEVDLNHGARVVGLNPQYVADVAAYLKRCKAKQGVRFQMGDEMEPMRMETSDHDLGGDFVYTLMPMRI